MLQRARVAEEGQRGQLCLPNPQTPTKEKPGATQLNPLLVTASRDYRDAPGASAACRSAFHLMSRPGECRGISNCAQEGTALPDLAAKLTCPTPASGSVSELAAPWMQKRGSDGLCWLQQPEGSITQLSGTRMEKVTRGSLSLLPSKGLPCSPIMPVG